MTVETVRRAWMRVPFVQAIGFGPAPAIFAAGVLAYFLAQTLRVF
jgi:hypothetical protein